MKQFFSNNNSLITSAWFPNIKWRRVMYSQRCILSYYVVATSRILFATVWESFQTCTWTVLIFHIATLKIPLSKRLSRLSYRDFNSNSNLWDSIKYPLSLLLLTTYSTCLLLTTFVFKHIYLYRYFSYFLIFCSLNIVKDYLCCNCTLKTRVNWCIFTHNFILNTIYKIFT